ncbi:MAG: polysaccharide export protein [bacterium]|nr:polysaccharide export protein [bacterium]
MKKNVTKFLALCILVICICSVSFAGEHRIGKGDNLQIMVFGYDNLSMKQVVRSDGAIDYPLAGELTLAGLTSRDAEKLLAGKLSDYIRNPRVSITVVSLGYDKVFVLGEVKNPGAFQLPKGSTLLEGIALAGGAVADADLSCLSLISANGALRKVDYGALLRFHE